MNAGVALVIGAKGANSRTVSSLCTKEHVDCLLVRFIQRAVETLLYLLPIQVNNNWMQRLVLCEDFLDLLVFTGCPVSFMLIEALKRNLSIIVVSKLSKI